MNSWERSGKITEILSADSMALVAEVSAGNGQAQEAAKVAYLKPITMENARPVFNIPPDSRQARNDHPQMTLITKDLERVKKHLSDPRIVRDFKVIKSRSLSSRAWILEQNVAGWLVRRAVDLVDDVVHAGSKEVQVSTLTATASGTRSRELPVKSGERYTLSFTARGNWKTECGFAFVRSYTCVLEASRDMKPTPKPKGNE